jgi:hypothetical protein
MTVGRNYCNATATEEMKMTHSRLAQPFRGAHAPSRARFGALAETL